MKLTRDQVLVVMTVLTWTGVWTFWTGSWAFFGVAFVKSHPFLVDRALRRIVTCLFGAACCWAIKLTLDRLPAKPNGKAISVACALSVAASIGWASINWLVFYGIAPRWGSLALAGSLDVAQTVLCIFLAWAAGYFAVDLDWQARDARLRLAEMKNEAGGARQPSRQQQQIDPHFLFKALNDLSTFIAESKCARREQSSGRPSDRLGELEELVHQLRSSEHPRQPSRDSVLWLTSARGRDRVAADEICWIEAERDYVRIHTAIRSYFVRARLGDLEKRFSAHGFFRVHRSVLVRASAVTRIEAHGTRGYKLILENGVSILASRRLRSRVRELIDHP